MTRRSHAALAGVLLAGLAAPTVAQARFEVSVLATVPDPGFVALTTLGPDRTIYGGTFFPVSGNGGDGTPSKLFAWSPDGTLLHSYTIQGQDLTANHGVQATTVDAAGRVVVLDTAPARVLMLDPATGEQTTYATIPDLPSCSTAAAGAPCSQTLMDAGPDPDYAAWGPDGTLYVTDTQQATIFAVPPGGGTARVWLSDARFDSVMFGLTGIALKPDRHTIAVTTAASSPATAMTAGQLFDIPLRSDGTPGDPVVRYTSGPVEAPDGFAYAASGNAYVALLGPNVNQVVQLDPSGKELARFPAAGQSAPVPFDSPSSATFDGSRLIITNDAYFTADRSHQVLFAVDAGEPGAPVFIPPAAAVPGSGGTTPTAPARIVLRVTPRHLRVGRRAVLHLTARVVRGIRSAPIVAGTRVRLLRTVGRFDAHGRVTLRVRPRRTGLFRVRVTVSSATAGVAHVRVVRRTAR